MRVLSKQYSKPVLGLVIALVLIGTLVPAGRAGAVDSGIEEMTLSPTEKHYEVNLGETINDSFVLLNSGQTAYDFITYTSPYSVANGNYNAQYDVDAPRSDAYKWLQMDTAQWHADVRQTVTVPFTLRVPTNASPGGHYGIVFAETKPLDASSGIIRKKRLGMVLYVKVKGDVVNEGRTTNIATDWFYSHGPVTADISVEDKGNTDFIAKTKMTVSDLFGNVKYTSSKESNILPGTNRDITMSYDNAPWFGLFKVKVESTVMGSVTTRESYAVIVPYWLFLVLGIAILLGAIDVVRRKKSKAKQPRNR